MGGIQNIEEVMQSHKNTRPEKPQPYSTTALAINIFHEGWNASKCWGKTQNPN